MARDVQLDDDVDTAAEIPCWGSSKKTGIRRRFECFLSTNNGVGIDQQLAGDSNQDDFWRLARSGHAGDEGGKRLVGSFGTELDFGHFPNLTVPASY